MEDTTGSEGNGAVLLRRRRMEIRRIKMMTSGSACAEQPVSKRLRPVGGMYAPPGDEADEQGGRGVSACECLNGDRGALCGLGSDRGSERLQQDDSNCARNRMSVCGVVPDPDGQAAQSSLSAAWERPSGGQSWFALVERSCCYGRSGSGPLYGSALALKWNLFTEAMTIRVICVVVPQTTWSLERILCGCVRYHSLGPLLFSVASR